MNHKDKQILALEDLKRSAKYLAAALRSLIPVTEDEGDNGTLEFMKHEAIFMGARIDALIKEENDLCIHEKEVSCECCGTNLTCTHPLRDDEMEPLCYKDVDCTFPCCPIEAIRKNEEIK